MNLILVIFLSLIRRSESGHSNLETKNCDSLMMILVPQCMNLTSRYLTEKKMSFSTIDSVVLANCDEVGP